MPACPAWPPAVPTRLTYPGIADTYPATLLSASPRRGLPLRPAAGTEVAAQITGDYNFPNLAAAAAVGLHFEVPEASIAAALAGYNPHQQPLAAGAHYAWATT